VSLVRRAFERRAAGGGWGDPNRIPRPSEAGGYSTFAGRAVTEDQALRLIAVYACSRLLSETVATLPMGAFERRDDARSRLKAEPRWMDQPNPEMVPVTFLERVMASATLRGNSFILTPRDWKGDVVEMWPLHPDDVRVRRQKVGGELEYVVSGESRPLTPLEVLHVPAFGVPGPIPMGLSPIGYAAQAIGAGLAVEEFGARWFGDGAHPAGVLESDQDLDSKQALALQATWSRRHGGRRLPAVLGGGLKWKPISVTPEESQFLETRKFTVTEIARLFRVPPHMIADLERATFSNIEHQSIDFVVHSIRPWLVRFEQYLSRTFAPRRAFVRFNVEGLLRGDTLSRFKAYGEARNAGWLNVDEIRALEDMAPLPEGAGQAFDVPLNSNRRPEGDATPPEDQAA
jgi:HK97 family phage portal protein